MLQKVRVHMEVSFHSSGGFSCMTADVQVCVPFFFFYHTPAPALHFSSLHMPSDSRPQRFIGARFMFLAANARFLVAMLTAGSVFLPA